MSDFVPGIIEIDLSGYSLIGAEKLFRGLVELGFSSKLELLKVDE